MSSDVPPFSLTKPRYDQSTFAGRCKHFYSITNPKTLLATQEDVNRAKLLLDQFKSNTLPPEVTDEQLWEAHHVYSCAVHPDDGKLINPLFRFAAFAPMNMLIVPAMLLPSTINSVGRTIVVHWLNQSYNACVNYENSNKSGEVQTRKLVEGYAGAVTTSIAIALGATFLSRRYGSSTLVRAVLPCLATSAAGSANLLLMRRTELSDGIVVRDEDGVARGKSVKAGTNACLKCCGARVLWNIPIMTVPPVLMAVLTNRGLVSTPAMKIMTEVALVTAFLFTFVPPALAAFPQKDSMSAEDLEEEFHNMVGANGQRIERFYFNKGL